MIIKLLLFASTRECIGKSSITIKLAEADKNNISLKTLLLSVEKEYPELNESPQNLLSHCSIALNENYILPEDFEDTVLKEGDEVALLPPVSGG